MKLNHKLLTAALLMMGSLALAATAADPIDPTPTPLGAEKSPVNFLQIEILNLQDEKLGRIKDLGIDLINGRIVEVLVQSDGSLDVGGKIVAVPPLALKRDPDKRIYRLDASRELFKTAPAIDLAKWEDFGNSDRVAAAYHLFGQQTYFLENGLTSDTPASRAKVTLGYVERLNKLIKMPVGNFQNEKFGEVFMMTLNIPQGRILTVIILAPGNFHTKSIVPPRALAFNEARDKLLLDDTVEEYANEPRYIFTPAALGNDQTSQEESYTALETTGPVEQGDNYLDTDRTLFIYQNIRLAKIYHRNVQIGTMHGRVTLRGWVRTAEDQRRIGEIAIAASRLELVDNQLTVGRPVASP